MSFPILSIAIATYNSEKTLEKTLKSIKNQNYPQNRIEILVIDGGSTDNTLNLARKYRCKIIPNPKTELIFAKHIGFLEANGKYLVYLDSDEVLENTQSLRLKYLTFKKDQRIKGIMPSGYKTPQNYSPINNYINEVGDPFSFFIYRLSQDARFYIDLLSKKYKKIHEDKDCVVFSFFDTSTLPIIELMAGGGSIDLQYFRNKLPQIAKNPALVAFFFYFLVKDHFFLAVTKNDSVIHYSSASFQKYLKKIESRVKNNIFSTTMGQGGFSGREKFQPFWFQLKKYLFIPYAFSLILPLLDALYLLLTRKKGIYFIHLPLSIYTALLILFYSLSKILNVKPLIKSYGN